MLTAVAWPYANGPRHIGHVSGFGVPSDVFSRYQRMAGNRVLMVSGTDEHGTPITVQADNENSTPQETADKYTRQIGNDLQGLGLSYDLFTRTTTGNHAEVTQQIFLALHRNGYVVPKTTRGAISPSTGRTLPDRYVEGTCPICGFDGARGDQCDNCGNQLDAAELINPKSRINGETPKFVETEHYFLDLPAFTKTLGDWLSTKTDWRPNVLNFTKNLIDDMRPRPITRDLDWGVKIPLEGWRDQPLKRFYVWFDAVIGYFSASVEWARRSGNPDAWQEWWNNADARSYYFMGKDNITFHAQIWPALLFGHNGEGDKGGEPGKYGKLHLPDEIVSSEFLTMSGSKFSTSRGRVIYVEDFLRDFGPDTLRYFISVAGPETQDTDFTWDEFVRRTNFELANEWGNLVNRSISMAHKNVGAIPRPEAPTAADEDLKALSRKAFDTAGAHLARSRFKLAAAEAMKVVTAANKYLSDQEPWKLKDDPTRRDTVLHTALQVVSDANTLLTPFLPHSAQKVHEALGGTGVWAAQPELKEVDDLDIAGRVNPILTGDYAAEQAKWASTPIEVGKPLAKPSPLFTKLDPALGETGPEWAPIVKD
ncbi:methionyl-tRNA synthetase [Amycolatopsis mediterranei S699]|uniref:Methionine--tRNA ligase n=1 Tax=Amycolatopsis mediterranei (strain U-32) TaxID=749927 RepID=A0A0H3DJT0_AMYMU|nr:methionyl-tRNA synthetase [Amycolatopsis mediterranei U32]AFO81657.1 methionyl-tRNA synthetase [Amycolatopsis mediterranei S699]AGT88786.1 methionyl-tRNA synthetase [Amycolatopsis mediterranei RB]KDO07803.1 methionine--tRNA ligase [Amycolatopsis mediterranei]